MANKLYEENSIRAVAERIRLFSNNKSRTYTVSQMAQGVLDACQDQYEKGRDSGFDAGGEYVRTTEAKDNSNVAITFDTPNRSVRVTAPSGYYADGVNKEIDADPMFDAGFDAGIEYVKTEEARTGADVLTIVEVPNRSVEVSVTGGYYPQETVVNVDVQPVYYDGYNLGYDDGHSDGYDDGFAAGVESGGGGGGSTDPLLEEMLIVTDENYDDEGNQFYSVYKWLGLYHSNFSSFPWMLEVENSHPTLWLHVYIVVDCQHSYYDEETGETFIDYYTHNYSLTLEPDYGVNSIEEDEMTVRSFRIEGVRWSEDGV